MVGNQRPKPGKAEHLAYGVVGLYQTVTVEQRCLAVLKHDLLLLVAHPWHQSRGHPPGPQLFGITTHTAQVGEIVSCVGVGEVTALGLEDGVEAGYEQGEWDTSSQRFVAPREYLPRRGRTEGLGYRPEHVGGSLRHQCRGHSLARSVSHDYSHPASF